ncbi:hypothetical protein D770_02115 [Flammeovirgaceae bacterium 311]|nr:hypothetical protein D770_02115 [Flammeovirgaceae bacterium 311]
MNYLNIRKAASSESCKRISLTVSVSALLSVALFSACESPGDLIHPNGMSGINTATAINSPVAYSNTGNVVEVQTEHMNFIMPDEIPSGWTTFRYQNSSHKTHFFLLEKMPVFEGEQKGIEDYEEQIAPVFQNAMDLINEGKVDEGFAEFARFPAWASQIIYTGGVGLVAPGETAQVTLRLDPGLYVIECYVKTNGRFHSVDGMVKEMLVTEASSNALPPKKSTLHMTLSSTGGIEIEGKLRPGLHTIAVHFKDQVVHEHALGHDVHLVKLADDTNLEELEAWMNWINPHGLETPAPATFLAGVQEMPAGNTAYLSMVLKPGRYAWISEVPNASSKGMLKTFTIPAGGN